MRSRTEPVLYIDASTTARRNDEGAPGGTTSAAGVGGAPNAVGPVGAANAAGDTGAAGIAGDADGFVGTQRTVRTAGRDTHVPK